MTCRKCGHNYGGHSPKCPEVSDTPELDILVWQEGWDDGRGRNPKDYDHPAYLLGYLRGEAAAEEAENGSPWVSCP